MKAINRTAILVRPNQKFVEWVNWVDPENPVTLEQVQHEPSIYLIPTCGDDKETRARVKKACRKIMEEQFSAWYTDPAVWPQPRDTRMFERWFEWTSHSMVFDLSSAAILREEF